MRALPTDKPRKPGMSGISDPYDIAIRRELVDKLHATALKLDSTVFVAMLTVYYALIWGVSDQRDLIIATPVRGRNSDETENLMGYFCLLYTSERENRSQVTSCPGSGGTQRGPGIATQ